jgi:hypothetical protein
VKQLKLVYVIACLAACGGSGDSRNAARDTLTERQRDSILAKSRIPGASGVGRAMTAADSTSARIQQANAVAADTTPR